MDQSLPNEITNNKINFSSFYIAGIGASAGGLEAITEFFDNVNPDIECAFVIIQHLSPDYISLMPELLANHTQIPIQVAEEDMIVQPRHIYLIPRKKNMTIENGKLKLRDKDKQQSPNMTIDIFFNSLAACKKEKAIAIILSGTGSDGTKGLLSIKNNGGISIVQDPLTSKFDGMPVSAINAGLADMVLSPELIPEEILNLIEQTPQEKSNLLSLSEADEKALEDILSLIKTKTGYDFTAYKRPTIVRRISRRMAFKNLKSFTGYKGFLYENPEEITLLGKEFLIGVTKFFRDAPAFDFLAKKIIPDIINSKEEDDVIKIWVAGCSTGEEAYSIAMLMYEYQQQTEKKGEVKIFATDLDKNAVEKASKGIFSDKSMEEIENKVFIKYFERNGHDFTVAPFIRKMIIFAHHDLVKDAPFSRMDLISCRNLLIYFGPDLQKKTFSKFHFSLNTGGYLFLGSSENLGHFSTFFTEVNKKWKIYKSEKRYSLPDIGNYLPSPTNSQVEFEKIKTIIGPSQTGSYAELFINGVIEMYGYAGIFVNESFEIVHAIGNFRQYLYFPNNTLDFNILKMVSQELSVILGSTIRKCFKKNESVKMSSCRIGELDDKKVIDLIIQPATDKRKNKLVIVYIKETDKVSLINELTTAAPEISNEGVTVQLLQQELSETKENLQSLVEELETTNEEMQASNEELTSSNEELQSTNEELQSLNEELHTVNAEHQLKIKELIELNDDLNNYFSSTDIGQVFVDKNLYIRKFTPAVKRQINLIENDIGRPISHISNNIKSNTLLEDLYKVIATSEIIEREIQLSNGKWYLMKVMPYITHDHSTNGGILAFIDITNLKELNDHFSGILNSSPNGIATYEAVRNEKGTIIDFNCTLSNPALNKIFDKNTVTAFTNGLLHKIENGKHNEMFEKFVSVVENGTPIHVEYRVDIEGQIYWLELSGVKINSGLAVTVGNITEKKISQEKMREAFIEIRNTKDNLQRLNDELERRVHERTKELSISEERFRLLSLATNDAIWDWNFLDNKVWWNEGFKKIFGYADISNVNGIEMLFDKIHAEDKERVVQGIQEVISSGSKIWSGEYRLQKADGTYAFVLDRAYVLQYEEEGIPFRMIGSMIDLSTLKKAQMQLEHTNENLMKINTDLDNFIYTASHDLKSPISNIEGLMSAMEDALKEHGLLEKVQIGGIVNMINLSINRFKNTIRDLTEIAKIQKENMEDLEQIPLKELVEEILFSIKDLVVKSNANIVYQLQTPTVTFSKRNIRSIIYNLISNAIKYRSAERDLIITISSIKSENYTMVNIEDNGLGIPQDKQSKVFGMFKRMHNHVEGTGIGLYIVKRAIENAGGRIYLESEEGKGSQFKLYFPNEKLIKKTEQSLEQQ